MMAGASVKVSKTALFLSGLFFGGAIDHVILAVLGRELTPYGVRSGVVGNWMLGGFDLMLAAGLYRIHNRTGAESKCRR